MGAVLLSCITKTAITKARTTFCSSLPRPRLSPAADVASVVENASAAYSGTTAAPHEYFDQTAGGCRPSLQPTSSPVPRCNTSACRVIAWPLNEQTHFA